MTVLTDFSAHVLADTSLVVALEAPTAIGGWPLQFQVGKRRGWASGLLTKSCASGYNNVSGMAVTNSGAGVFSAAINSANTSGWDPGVYAYQIERLSSGARTVLTQGSLLLLP